MKFHCPSAQLIVVYLSQGRKILETFRASTYMRHTTMSQRVAYRWRLMRRQVKAVSAMICATATLTLHRSSPDCHHRTRPSPCQVSVSFTHRNPLANSLFKHFVSPNVLNFQIPRLIASSSPHFHGSLWPKLTDTFCLPQTSKNGLTDDWGNVARAICTRSLILPCIIKLG